MSGLFFELSNKLGFSVSCIPTPKGAIFSLKKENNSNFKDEIKEIKDILKEAGIIVIPPKNISVPDPRGYSVNKIK